MAEAWRKSRYRAAFVSKLNDAESETAETQLHVEITFRHSYFKQEVFHELDDACDKILAQIVEMIDHADRWVIKPRPDPPPHEDADAPTRQHVSSQASGGA